MGCFPRAAHRDVSHRDDGRVESTAFEDAHFEEMVSQPYHESIAPTQGQQPLVDSYGVVFHCFKYGSMNIQFERYASLNDVLLVHGLHQHEGLVELAKSRAQLGIEVVALGLCRCI